MELYPEESIEEETMLSMMDCVYRWREVQCMDHLLDSHERELLQEVEREIFSEMIRDER